MLLLVLPAEAFSAIVPVLILLGCVLVVFQPRISARVAARHEAGGGLPDHGAWWVWPAVLLTGVYGGYFGAAQGVLLMAVLGIGVDETLQRPNATKNVLALSSTASPRSSSSLVADVDWRRRRADRRRLDRRAARSGPTWGRRLPAAGAAHRHRDRRRGRAGVASCSAEA